MVTSESNTGPTPNGGVRSTIYYVDEDGNPVDKAEATACEIVEFDANGNGIHRTYASLRPPRADDGGPAERSESRDQPRVPAGQPGGGQFGSGEGGSDKPDAGHEEKAKGIASRVVAAIGKGVRVGVAKAMTALDEEFKGGLSLIVGGLKNRDPASVLYGVSRAITSSVCTETHEEVWENALAGHSFGGAHGAGVVAAKVLTAAEQGLLRGIAAGLKKVGLKRSDLAAELRALADNLSKLDSALVDVAVEHTLAALKSIYSEAGVEDKIDLPEARDLRQRLVARLLHPSTKAAIEEDKKDD